MKRVVLFSEVGHGDLALVGGKGANLGEMLAAGLPVPPGFIVTADAYYEFVRKNKIDKLIAKTLKGLDPEDTARLNKSSSIIKLKILESDFTHELERTISEQYHKMAENKKDLLVAVRSSATAEDLPEASFAGQQATFLNVSGAKKVVEAVKKCFASLFEPRAIYYRVLNNFDHNKVGIAVPVQEMVQSDVSGIMFTVDPVTGDRSRLMIEAGLGLGEAIVSGSITPDRYLVDKKSFKILDKEVNTQEWAIVRDKKTGKDIHQKLTKEEASGQKMSDDKIMLLARLGQRVENHYKSPQDTEWAMEDGEIFIVQARPITTLEKTDKAMVDKSPANDQGGAQDAEAQTPEKAEVLVKGAAASLGMATGVVKIIHSPKEIDKIEKGDVLVTEMTNPDYVPAMRRASAIVTDAGGRTSHAAIVSRELGIPCVVGTGQATSKLKGGLLVTVDGASGLVYKGKVAKEGMQNQAAAGGSRAPSGSLNEGVPVTGTKVYINLGEPDRAVEAAALPVDGVGLMRAEFIMANIAEHPKAMLKGGRKAEFISKLAEGISTIASAFNPRPVVYRASDFRTNEYRNMKGGAEFEPEETNPMIGYRGAFRYISDPETFLMELEAIRQVRDASDLKNVHMMIPYIHTVEEWVRVRDMVNEFGLHQGPDFKLYMMCELPSNVILLEDFIAEGIDGVSIGSNDLTQMTLGVDRDNEKLASVFDERNKAVTKSLEYIVKTCRRHGKSVSICGQAPSVYPEITEMLVKSGITAVSVSLDMALTTRKLIASVERRMMLNQIVDN